MYQKISILFIFAFQIASINLFSQSAPIAIDGNFDEWTSNLIEVTDPKDQSSGLDLLEMQVANDDQFLYIRFETKQEYDILDDINDQKLTLYLDTDQDDATGSKVKTGIGAELQVRFNQRSATQYASFNTNVSFSDFSFRIAPTVTSAIYEIAIKRNAVPNGQNALFTGNAVSIYLMDVESGDELPIISYTFDDTPVPAYEVIDIDKEDPKLVRLVAYNTEFDGLTKSSNLPHFEQIIKALKPDIVGFSECKSTSAAEVKSLFDNWLPLENSFGWYVARNTVGQGNGDLITISRWPISKTWTTLPRQFPTLIDLPREYQSKFLFTNAHLNCCNNDAARQNQVDAYASFMLDLRDGELEYKTPFAYGGDLNLVGKAQQLKTLVEGDIQNTATYGEGGKLDWDNSVLSDLNFLQTDQRMNYTWRSDNSSYPPGKLDFIIVSDAAVDVQKSFVLQTEIMSDQRLNQYGLSRNNTSSASDHYPVVADFSFRDYLGITQKHAPQFKAFPNPTSNIIHIINIPTGAEIINVLDVLGNKVSQVKVLGSAQDVDLSALPNGIYFIQLKNKFASSQMKVVKL